MSEENHVEEDAKPVPTGGKFLSYGCFVWALVGVFCFGLLIVLFLPAICPSPEPARRVHCRNNLKQIALALHKYNQEYNCFPPAYTVDEQGKPMHSWRALILPFFDYEWNDTEYDFSQPWNSPKNIEFANTSRTYYDLFRCPTEYGYESNQRDTSYVMLVGPNAFGNGTTCRKLNDIRDGSGNTIMLTEMSHSGIFWTEPRDLNVEEMSYKPNDPHQIGMRSEHFGGLHIGLGDGSVRWISDSIDPKSLQAVITINGNENMDELGD